jgi:tetrahydromethanopterin S-methyltransferase subunit G
MSMDYDRDFCNERHKTIDKRLDNTESDFSDLVDKINGKFNKIICMFIGVQFTIIAALIVFIITGKQL